MILNDDEAKSFMDEINEKISGMEIKKDYTIWNEVIDDEYNKFTNWKSIIERDFKKYFMVIDIEENDKVINKAEMKLFWDLLNFSDQFLYLHDYIDLSQRLKHWLASIVVEYDNWERVGPYNLLQKDMDEFFKSFEEYIKGEYVYD